MLSNHSHCFRCCVCLCPEVVEFSWEDCSTSEGSQGRYRQILVISQSSINECPFCCTAVEFYLPRSPRKLLIKHWLCRRVLEGITCMLSRLQIFMYLCARFIPPLAANGFLRQQMQLALTLVLPLSFYSRFLWWEEAYKEVRLFGMTTETERYIIPDVISVHAQNPHLHF